MRLDQFNVPADVRRLLDDDVLTDVVAQFHPGGECRICGNRLGEKGKFSLWINEIDMVATVMPLHAPCMASAANSPDFLGVPAGEFQTLPVALPVQDDNGTWVTLPVLCVNPSVDLVTLVADQATGRLRDNRVRTLTGQGWATAHEPIDPRADPVGAVVKPSGANGQWRASTILGDWTFGLPYGALVEPVERISGLYVFAFFHHDIHHIAQAPDPQKTLGEAFLGEPALVGRLTLT